MGSNDDEFAVDERDLLGDVRLDMDLKANYLKGDHKPRQDVVPGTTPDRNLADSDDSLDYRPLGATRLHPLRFHSRVGGVCLRS